MRIARADVIRPSAMGNDPVTENHESNYDQLLVGAARAGGPWRPDLRPNRPVLRLFRNGIVYRPRGKTAAPRDLGDEQPAAHPRDGRGDRPRRSPWTDADPRPPG